MGLAKIAVCCLLAMFLFTAAAVFAADHAAPGAAGHQPTAKAAASTKAADTAPPAQELNDKIDAARKTADEAATAANEALTGKAPDPNQPPDEYKADKTKRKFLTLSDDQRVAGFDSAAAKYAEAIRKVEEVLAALKAHPGVIPAGPVEQLHKTLKTQLAATLVAQVKFRMAKNIGDLATWQRLVADALKADKTNADALQLDATLKAKARQAEQANKSTQTTPSHTTTPTHTTPRPITPHGAGGGH